MSFGPRGLETALPNRTGRGRGRPAGRRLRPHVRRGCNGSVQAALGAGVVVFLRPWGSRAGTWAAQVLAGPLLRSTGLAADVAPGTARVLIWVPAVTVVTGAWEGRQGAMGLGQDRGRCPSAAQDGYSPSLGAEARLFCASSQLRQRRPGVG